MAFRGDIEALILASLGDGPKFGYDIARFVKEKSGKVLKLGEGQLYPVLHRLERQGQVASKWELPKGKTPRKVYQLSELGAKSLEVKRKAWKEFVKGVEGVLSAASAKPEAAHG